MSNELFEHMKLITNMSTTSSSYGRQAMLKEVIFDLERIIEKKLGIEEVSNTLAKYKKEVRDFERRTEKGVF